MLNGKVLFLCSEFVYLIIVISKKMTNRYPYILANNKLDANPKAIQQIILT